MKPTHRLIEGNEQHTSADPAIAREQVLIRLRLLDSNGRSGGTGEPLPRTGAVYRRPRQTVLRAVA